MTFTKALHQYLYLFLVLVCSSPLFAETQQSSHSFGPNFNENSRSSFDFSSRFTRDLSNHHWSSTFAIGFDYHKVFTSEHGDIGTLTFQPYWVQLVNTNPHPFFFENEDDGELTWRIANFNYTGLSNGQFNIRLGHFEIPFGLEQNIGTNGTTRQFTFTDRGIKADWGVSINGILPALEYEIALTQGSGNDITNKHDPYLFSGRIGTLSTANFIAGFSWLHGDILNGSGTVKRERIGLDLSYYYYQWEILFELSGGEDDNYSKTAGLMELSWRNPTEEIHSYMQYRDNRQETEQGWRNGDSLTLGLNWNINTKIIISTQWSKELNSLSDNKTASQLILQFRVRT